MVAMEKRGGGGDDPGHLIHAAPGRDSATVWVRGGGRGQVGLYDGGDLGGCHGWPRRPGAAEVAGSGWRPRVRSRWPRWVRSCRSQAGEGMRRRAVSRSSRRMRMDRLPHW